MTGWLNKLRDDRKLSIPAAAQAQSAVDFILTRQGRVEEIFRRARAMALARPHLAQPFKEELFSGRHSAARTSRPFVRALLRVWSTVASLNPTRFSSARKHRLGHISPRGSCAEQRLLDAILLAMPR